MSDVEKRIKIRRSCARSLSGHGEPTMRERLAGLIALPESEGYPDLYGFGDPVTLLERRVAELLDKPAARFVVKGMIAQQAALRTWTDSVRIGTVALHPLGHIDSDELGAFERLHPLRGVRLGGKRGFGVEDLEKVGEPLGAVVVELPLRNAGFALPEWDDLVAQTSWARDRGAAAHLDGARLWEASAGYGRSPAAVAALFDTVYVSFYKGIGALPGCCVAGSAEDVAQVREWRGRMGGTLFALWPAASSALGLLDASLAEMPARLTHARAIAAALAWVPEIRVVPDPPQTPMMHLLFRTTTERFRVNAKRISEETGLWVWPNAVETGDPAVVRCELSVGRATLRHKPEKIAEILTGLCA